MRRQAEHGKRSGMSRGADPNEGIHLRRMLIGQDPTVSDTSRTLMKTSDANTPRGEDQGGI